MSETLDERRWVGPDALRRMFDNAIPAEALLEKFRAEVAARHARDDALRNVRLRVAELAVVLKISTGRRGLSSSETTGSAKPGDALTTTGASRQAGQARRYADLRQSGQTSPSTRKGPS